MIPSVIIIGSGLGGLLCGYLLSKEGHRVTVLEKHRKFGGCLQSFRRESFTFDTGMHYIPALAPDQPLYRYWKYFGLTDKLELVRMDPGGFDRISFEHAASGERFQGFPLAQGMENFREQLVPFIPNSGSSLMKYTDTLNTIVRSHPLYNLELTAGETNEAFGSIPASDFLTGLGSRIPDSGSRILFSSVLAGNNLLYGGNPGTTPLRQYGLINHSFISSAWRLAGGSQQLADLLVEGIRAYGGQVLARKKVTAIRREIRKFHICTEEDDRFEADLTISGLHPAMTLQLLDGIAVQKAYRERILSLDNTPSVFSVYLGLKPERFPFLNYNVYHHLSPDIWADPTPPPYPKGEPGVGWPGQFLFMTPPEKGQGPYARTAVILSPMRYDEVSRWADSASGARDKSYFAFKAKKAKQLLEAVYRRFPNLKEAVVTVDISTPLTWRDYTGTPEGSMYGIVKDASNSLKTSVSPRTKVPGLYFTGQSVNLHGALGVTIGAVMTCGEILGLPYVLERIRQEG